MAKINSTHSIGLLYGNYNTSTKVSIPSYIGSITPRSCGEQKYGHLDPQVLAPYKQLSTGLDTEITQILQPYDASKSWKADLGLKDLDTLRQKIQEYQELDALIKSKIVFEFDYQDGVRSANLEHVAPRDANKPLVKRFGIDSTNLKIVIGEDLKDKLHEVEKHLFTKALTELNKCDSAEAYMNSQSYTKYPDNAVLVDVFKRDQNNKIAADDNNGGKTPETHTIVLWKKTN